MRQQIWYTRGPQGNQISDHRAEYLARYGSGDPDFKPGTPGMEDKRMIFNATEIGTMILADRAAVRNGQ